MTHRYSETPPPSVTNLEAPPVAPAAHPIGMTLHFEDVTPVATCTVIGCRRCFHGDSVNDAVLAWTAHISRDHRGDWGDDG